MSTVIYRIAMTHPGRPVERPAHLSPEQRLDAQNRTKHWRELTRLSQRDVAAEIGVSLPTYRPWENGSGQNAGPTRLQAEQLDKALRRLLPGAYIEGEAFDAWGWPRQQDMSYGRVAEVLRGASFDVPRLQSGAGASVPANVFWVHKVRDPNLLHAVFALAAAAATRADLSVHLLLDDVGLSDRERVKCDELESRIRNWVAFASGDDSKLTTGLFSKVLTEPYVADRGWQAVNDYLRPPSTVLEILLASKVVDPVLYSTQDRDSLLGLLNDSEFPADRLLTPLRNWLVFEEQMRGILGAASGPSGPILTLGGADERYMWDVWRRGCSDELAARVQHIYLEPMPMPSYPAAWNTAALSPRTHRTMLANYVTDRMRRDGNTDLLEWLLKSAVRLPADLNPGFSDGLDTSLQDIGALLRAPAGALSEVVGPACKAVAEWLSIPVA